MRAALEYLPGDVFPLSELERQSLAADPHLSGRPGLIVPRRLESIPIPPDPLDSDERGELAANWEANLATYQPHVAVLESVRKLAEPAASIVLVQAPPHFCGGPLNVVYRALHAIRLARSLSAEWGKPVVPVFWNQSDGHDLDSIRNLELLNDNFNLRRVSPASLGSNCAPVSRIILEEELHRLGPLREFLRQEFTELSFRDVALEAAFPREGESLETAFSRWLLAVFGPMGLVVLEPDWVRNELSRALAGLVLQDPARDLAPDETDPPELLFRVTDTRRTALRPGGEGFQYHDETGSRTIAELAAVIVQDPESWSPGELLLPLAQEAVLPIAAHIGTWTQWKSIVPMAEHRVRTELAPAVFVPCLRGTLIDPDCESFLKSGAEELVEILTVPTSDDQPDTDSAPIADRMRELSARAAGELRSLRAELAELDRGLSIQLKRTAGSLQGLVENLAARVDRSVRNRGGKRGRRIRRLRNSLLPHDQPQEDVLSSLPFFARHGTDWLEGLMGQLDDLPTEHLVLRLEESENPT